MAEEASLSELADLQPEPELEHAMNRLEHAVGNLNSAMAVVQHLGFKVEPIIGAGDGKHIRMIGYQGSPLVRVLVSKEFSPV